MQLGGFGSAVWERLSDAGLAAGGLGYGTKRWLDSGIRDAGAIDLTSSAIVDGAGQKGGHPHGGTKRCS